MFNVRHIEAIKTIREWFDEISYSSLNNYMMQFVEQTGQLYPDFNKFMGSIDRINPLYAFIFSLFRLGQPTERTYLDTFLPTQVIDSLLETGLLRQKGTYYQMPEIGIIPLGGMYFVAGLPEVYSTVARGGHYKPVDNFIQIIMNEIASQPIGSDFLEVHADYGILANMAAVKGFKNIQIQPRHPEFIPFIQMNLALNYHDCEIITNITKEYDLIACVHLSVTKKVESRNQSIANEKEIIHLFPVFRQLKETGQAILLLESIGTISAITINTWIKDIEGLNIQSVALKKVPFPLFVMTGYTQSSWEQQFELVPYEYADYVTKSIESSGDKAFVFSQLLKIKKRASNEPFALYPFYNPKYSDPLFNYASLTV